MSANDTEAQKSSFGIRHFFARFHENDHAIGLAIAVVYVVWLLLTAKNLGFARDEGFYFHASTDYSRWFALLFEKPRQAFERSAIDASWTSNHEHPALMKSLFALSWMFLHEKWHLFKDASTAFRFPGMMMMGVAIYVTYLFGLRAYSRRAGVIAAGLLGLAPNVFYNAHLACFDVPIMAMWTACIYVYWRAEQKGGAGWALFAGVMYGLTLETKHNAWMLPAVFVTHSVVTHWKDIGRNLRVGKLRIPASLVFMMTVGPAVFIALWPWLWNDTLPRIQEWFNFHLHHEYYNIEFLGENYFAPPSPRAYMPVMIFATVPTVTILLFVVGASDRLWIMLRRLRAWAAEGRDAAKPKGFPPAKDKYQTDLLLFLGLCVPLAVFLLPRTPIFGGTKHWFPAYPFLAVFAGRGFDLAATSMSRTLALYVSAKRRPLAEAALLLSVVVAPLLVTMHSHPFGLSAYVPFVGGTAGGADLGLNRQFWGFTTQSLNAYFKANAKKGATVFIHDTAWDSWGRMVAENRVPSHLRGVGTPGEADFSIVHHELHMAEIDYNIWMAYGSPTPDFVLTHDGVPIISVYKRDHGKR